MDDILPFVYEGELMRSPHKAAVLYFVFAAGSLMDPNLPPRNPQAQAFCELGLKALDLRNISTSTELDTVIAVSLLASYHGNLGTENCLETAWEEMSLAIKIAQKVGPSSLSASPSGECRSLTLNICPFRSACVSCSALISPRIHHTPSAFVGIIATYAFVLHLPSRS